MITISGHILSEPMSLPLKVNQTHMVSSFLPIVNIK